MERRCTTCDHLDPTVLLLRRLFVQAATPLLVTLLPACNNNDAIPSYPGRPYCVEGAWVPTSNLDLPQEVAYASLRRKSPAGVQIESESGVPCQGAKDQRLCEAEIDRVSVRDVLSDGQSFLLTTDGDMIEAFRTYEEKLNFLGRVDTPDEALLFAFDNGYNVTCDTKVGREGDGYGIVFTVIGCGNSRVDTFVRMSAEGLVRDVRRETYGGPECSSGRRPPGLIDPRSVKHARSSLGRYLANGARLEAASVDAFVILERELVALGLPCALRDELRKAADDEVRHARDTSRLAERFGARPERPEIARTGPRTLAEIAHDNAVEGCVSETYSAYLAHLQAACARDPELARVFRSIAEEETRHAALSWQLAAWLEPQLDPATRKRIHTSRRQAIARLGLRAA